MKQDYKKLKEVIQKANPKIAYKCRDGYVLKRQIELNDVLIALGDKLEGDYILDSHYLTFVIDEYEEWTWDLKENLDNQTDETKQFLINRLVK